jgi:hypothetical protein
MINISLFGALCHECRTYLLFFFLVFVAVLAALFGGFLALFWCLFDAIFGPVPFVCDCVLRTFLSLKI